MIAPAYSIPVSHAPFTDTDYIKAPEEMHPYFLQKTVLFARGRKPIPFSGAFLSLFAVTVPVLSLFAQKYK
ncbi:hypothetical protein [Pseudoflavonifractor phocaeensis]|uniref:hypothetical protein n=1 Tax=Pseudoflavonifractor phocaeensis TaxID=1870988 RepID=UPI00195E6086|nr:hypothetical protein [Pseudoflavonifractor phocaeensis]